MNSLGAQEARQIAKEAYIYGFPLVTNYETLHKQAVDTAGHDYRAPFNTIASLANVATPEDKFVVTPNSDTPYSFLWMDLRAEPIVVTMPKVEEGRYYSGQLIDLYTFNFAYIGSRVYGNDGGDFLVAGPGWSEATPKGIKAVIHTETEFAYILFRTQLFNPGDRLPLDHELRHPVRVRFGFTQASLTCELVSDLEIEKETRCESSIEKQK